MTNLKDQQQQQLQRDKQHGKPPPNIKTSWSTIEALNQLMTPVPLSDSDLQQELDFYASTQFKYSNSDSIAPSTTPSPSANNNSNNRSSFSEQQQQLNNSSNTTFKSSTPQLTIPVDANDFASSNLRNNNNFPSSSSATNQNINHQDMNSLSLLSEHQQQQQQQRGVTNDHNNTENSLLLGHEPGVYSKSIAASQSALSMLNNNSIFSKHSTLISSLPNSPTVYDEGVNYFQTATSSARHPTDTASDRFATMFLSSNDIGTINNINEEESIISRNKRTKKIKNDQKIRSKNDTIKQQPLDYLLLSQHNMEQELLSPIKKDKQKETSTAVKRRASKKKRILEEYDEEDRRMSDNEDDEGGDEDEPVIGDGAQSYSSMGSNGSRSSLSKDDKRKRNTAASARFRIKKKMREQALQNTACEMTDKAKRMEQRVHELEREIKWLKALVVEKNDTRLEQLVRQKPPNSTDFPSSSSASTNNRNYFQQQNDHHNSGNNDEYYEYEEDDDNYSNQY